MRNNPDMMPQRMQADVRTTFEVRNGDSLFILETCFFTSKAVPKRQWRNTGAELRYSGYRPPGKSASTEKPKRSPCASHFATARIQKQRGKVPSKLPAFLTALLYSIFPTAIQRNHIGSSSFGIASSRSCRNIGRVSGPSNGFGENCKFGQHEGSAIWLFGLLTSKSLMMESRKVRFSRW